MLVPIREGRPSRGEWLSGALQGEVGRHGGLSLRVNVVFVIPVSEPTNAGGFDGIHLRVRVNERQRFISRRCAGTLTKGKRHKNGFRHAPE